MRDVIVIGTGAGGAVIAKELAARGLDVLMLEAGAHFDDPENQWTHFENDANNPSFGFLRFGPADRSKPAWTRDLAQNSFVAQVSGVGGTTKHYFGNAPRAMPGVFVGYSGRDRLAYDVAHQFPFSYRELIPYYEWTEFTLPVQTAAIGTKEEVFLSGAGRLGLAVQKTKDVTRASYRAQENAILQPSGTAGLTSDPGQLLYPRAQGCTFCGHCLQGCFQPVGAPRNLKAKRSTDNNYVPMALTAGKWTRGKDATLIPDAFVVSINTEGQTDARGVTWRVGSTGELFTEESRVVVLSAGAVESPRLWLNSNLPNPNGWVGRGLTEHYPDIVVGVFPFYTGHSKGPGSAARCDFPGFGSVEVSCFPPAQTASILSSSDAGISGYYDNGLPTSAHGADTTGRLTGELLQRTMSDIDRLLMAIVLTDDDVEQQNTVTLSTTLPPDEHGPRARITVASRARSVRTLRNREYVVARTVELMKLAGASRVHRLNPGSTMLHLHSTLRMGIDENSSVLDANGQSRAVKRLFVADCSALANALGGPNPSLTCQALATRTAEKIFSLYFDGDAWVHRESPISSIDDRVTQAVLQTNGGKI